MDTPIVIASMSNATYQGSSGHTPVKGVDYLTPEEIQEIASEISVIPISNQEILNLFEGDD